jgi:ABC-type transporter Mla subunit MlaD
MASLLIDSLLKSAATSSALHAHPYHQLLLTQLQQVSHDVRDDYRQLQQDVGNAQTLLSHYQQVLQAAQRQHYALPLSTDTSHSSQ